MEWADTGGLCLGSCSNVSDSASIFSISSVYVSNVFLSSVSNCKYFSFLGVNLFCDFLSQITDSPSFSYRMSARSDFRKSDMIRTCANVPDGSASSMISNLGW